jgi:chemotaxis signal transduction protein
VTGYVLFRLGERRFVAVLDEVREIVRLTGVEALPAALPPLVGITVLRGSPLPVLDVRGAGAALDNGDILVMTVDGDAVGIAVDEVVAVLGVHELSEADAPAKSLPDYVIGVRRDSSGPLLMVDLRRLLDATSSGWQDALDAGAAVIPR